MENKLMNKLDAKLAHVDEATLPYPLLKPLSPLCLSPIRGI